MAPYIPDKAPGPKAPGPKAPGPRAPSIELIPTLSPKVYKYDLLWAIWIWSLFKAGSCMVGGSIGL